MKKYLLIARLSVREYSTYRINFALEIFGGIIMVLAILLVWLYVFENRAGMLGDYTTAEMVTYFVMAGFAFSFIFITAQGDEIDDYINQGDLSFLLVKPIHPIGFFFMRDCARKIMTGGIGIIGIAALYFFFSEYVLPPPSTTRLLGFFALLMAGSLVHFYLFSLGSIASFWLGRTWGIRFVLRVVMELFMGMLIPLSLFPSVWEHIAYAFPFHFMIYTPVQMYLGKNLPFGIGYSALLLIAWIAVLAWVHQKLYQRGLRAYAAPNA